MGSGGGSAPNWGSPTSFSSDDVKAFKQSQSGASFNDAQLAYLTNGNLFQTSQGVFQSQKNQGYGGPGTFQGADDQTALVQAFQAWATARGKEQDTYNQYTALTQQDPGRESTVLTGAGANNYSTLLTNVVVGSPNSSSAVNKTVGVPPR